MVKIQYRMSVRLTAILLLVIFFAVLLESGSRVAYHYQDELSGISQIRNLVGNPVVLDPYEIMSSEKGGHWKLRPGYGGESTKKSNLPMRGGIRVNNFGYKGPELKSDNSHTKILAVGDSTTFGGSEVDYPREMERFLQHSGYDVEVVNGGVEGYSTRNVIYETTRYAQLKPDIVVLYLGWNDLYSPERWLNEAEQGIRFLWLLRNVSGSISRRFIGEYSHAINALNRKAKPDFTSKEVMWLDDYTPPFIGNFEEIIDSFEAVGSEIFLVTLPGLFTTYEYPSFKALEIGHLPLFTDNPYVLAKITERLNQSIRDIAQNRNLHLIDLEIWGRTNLKPRENYFNDSVHLNAEGLTMLGAFMAKQLKSFIHSK